MTDTEAIPRAEAIFDRYAHESQAKMDRVMLVILLAQWVLAVIIALTASPFAWSGKIRSVHVHLQIALALGGVLNSLPIALIVLRPGWWLTRQVVATTQMLWSALLIHLTGGRIETHFHVFGSLAFLAFYRDWRLLPTATAVVAGDHLIRGLLWPESVYGIPNPEWWRFLEHAGWVAFEDIVLLFSCLQATKEMRANAEREAASELLNERVEAEVSARTAELDASRDQYRAILETTNTIPWELDPETTEVLYLGPQARETFGFPMDRWYVPGFVMSRVHPEDRERVAARLKQAQIDRRNFELEYRMLTADERALDLRSIVSVAEVDGGRVVLRGLLFDVSAQKKLEAELRQAQKLESVGRLAAGIAHEINTPVQFVSDNCHFLRGAAGDIKSFLTSCREVRDGLATGEMTSSAAASKLAAAEEQADIDYLMADIPTSIEQSLDGLQRVATIVRSMKQFAHPGQKEKTPTNINDAVQSTLTIARNEYKYIADVKLELGHVPTIPCYASDLNQAILNITVNAAHAIGDVVRGTEQRGEIAVRTWEEGGHVCLSIRDTGGGIPPHVRERIFDPFFTTKEVGRGTGQGLAIVRSVVVEKHGGTVRVESEPGVGSIFTIRLPCARDGEREVAA